MPQRRMGWVEWGMLLAQSMLWGSAYFFQAVAVKELPPVTIMAARLVPAVAVLLLIALLTSTRLPHTFAAWRPYLILGPINTVLPGALIIWGQREVSGGLAAVLTSTTPLFGILLAHALTHDEKISVNKLAGILIGITGVAVLVGGAAVLGAQAALASQVAILAACVLYAHAALYAHRLTGEAPMRIAFCQAACALLFAVPLALIVEQPWTLAWPSTNAALSVVAMGLLSSAFAAIVYFSLLKRAGPTNTFLVTLLLPLTPIALGALLLDERLSTREVFGAGIIACALIVIDGRIFRR